MKNKYDIEIKESKPLTKEEIKKMGDRLYAGELRDLAHLRGIRAASYPKTEKEKELFKYKGDIAF